MAHEIRTASVIGSGVMGSAIAAHLAGAGIPTLLFDIVPPNLSPEQQRDPRARNQVVQAGLERAQKTKPALFYHADAARLISIGNLEDDLGRLETCDLVIEAIVENLEVKKKLFERIAPKLRARAILASNTSGLSIAGMQAVLPEALKSRFLVMHFFNPVRYMRLLEIAPAPGTDPEVLRRATEFGEFLGKGVVYAKDTTNFIANRIGVYSMMQVLHLMLEEGLGIEVVDKIVGAPLGRPKSAAFGTADLVGIDTFKHVAQNCYDSLPDDEERDVFRLPTFVLGLIERGALGRKSGAGFYKKVGSEVLVLDVQTGEYRPEQKVRFDSLGRAKNEDDPRARIKLLVGSDDVAGRFAWKVLSRCLAYSARRIPEIADSIVEVDRALKLGFNWDLGPFEAWDALGVADTADRMRRDGIAVADWVERMIARGQTSFYSSDAVAPAYYDVATGSVQPIVAHPKALTVKARKARAGGLVKQNFSASLVDLGDGALGVEVHTKLNTVDVDVIKMLDAAVEEAEANFEAIVIGNDGEHFGAGANIMLMLMAAQQKAWEELDRVVRALQNACQRLRYARVPVVAAPCQYTFGGAAEIAMSADSCQAYAETYMGLVEVGVGLIPAGSGCLRLVERFTRDAGNVPGADLLPFIGEASLNIAMAKVATSAHEAKELRYLAPHDGISLNRDFLLYEAKQRALGLARAGYRPPLPGRLKAGGYDAWKTIGARIWGLREGGFASEHDALIANKVAYVLSGGAVAAGAEVDEQHYLDLEREAFLSLAGEPKTLERMQHMLMHNKPLRN